MTKQQEKLLENFIRREVRKSLKEEKNVIDIKDGKAHIRVEDADKALEKLTSGSIKVYNLSPKKISPKEISVNIWGMIEYAAQQIF